MPPVAPSSHELSIIVPVLNETRTLPGLFAMLSGQDRVKFEALLVDGGSLDGTPTLAGELASAAPFACRIIRSGKGRARQLNAGAKAALASTFLFLHADSSFSDPLALRQALDALALAVERRGNERVAGRFTLSFDLPRELKGFGYYFCECKARLDRTECTHGDQGFLLRRNFFENIGPFDESLPFLEDTRLAEAIRRTGDWILLPAEIITSARRFEVEGLFERQLLNALIMNFSAIGWNDFFKEAAGIYRSQDRAHKLRLLPYLLKIRDLLLALPRRERCRLWYETGSYVRSNAWQLAFALDARCNFSRGLPPGEGRVRFLGIFDRCFRITDHPPGRLIAAVLVWIWFHLTLLRRLLFENGPPTPDHYFASGEDE